MLGWFVIVLNGYASKCGLEAHEPNYAWTLWNMGTLYAEQNDVETAKPFFKESLVIFERLERKAPGLYDEIIKFLRLIVGHGEHE